MLLRIATRLKRPQAADLERSRVPWLLVLAGVVAVANVAAAIFTLSGQ